MQIVSASLEDHEKLSFITKVSKAYWGYSAEQLLLWDNELTISSTYIHEHSVYNLLVDNLIIGYYSFEHKNDQVAHLENLFILPQYIGQGFGYILLEDCLQKVSSKKYQKLQLESDPHAESFYAKFGFKVIGKKPSSIKGRFLPLMERELHT